MPWATSAADCGATLVSGAGKGNADDGEATASAVVAPPSTQATAVGLEGRSLVQAKRGTRKSGDRRVLLRAVNVSGGATFSPYRMYLVSASELLWRGLAIGLGGARSLTVASSSARQKVLPDFRRRFAVRLRRGGTSRFLGASPRTPKSAPAAFLVPPLVKTLAELLAGGTNLGG